MTYGLYAATQRKKSMLTGTLAVQLVLLTVATFNSLFRYEKPIMTP